MKSALAQEVANVGSVTTSIVNVDMNTDPSVITDLVPPTNANPTCDGASGSGGSADPPCYPEGPTPPSLQGVFWMRGNPLPDYLLSFANTHWTTVNGTPYGFLPTFAPGSFRLEGEGAGRRRVR